MKTSLVTLQSNTIDLVLPEFILNDFETGIEGFIRSENIADVYILNFTPHALSPISDWGELIPNFKPDVFSDDISEFG